MKNDKKHREYSLLLIGSILLLVLLPDICLFLRECIVRSRYLQPPSSHLWVIDALPYLSMIHRGDGAWLLDLALLPFLLSAPASAPHRLSLGDDPYPVDSPAAFSCCHPAAAPLYLSGDLWAYPVYTDVACPYPLSSSISVVQAPHSYLRDWNGFCIALSQCILHDSFVSGILSPNLAGANEHRFADPAEPALCSLRRGCLCPSWLTD